MIMNEKIRASEVQLTGVNGEDLGIVATKDALAMAKSSNVDLVCTSLLSSPPPCKLVRRADHQKEQTQAKQKERKAASGGKLKEIRLSALIEDHDYDTKKRQAERILAAGNDVQLTVLVENKKTDPAKRLAEELVRDLRPVGRLDKGIQVSGKQVIAILRAVRE
ncbi:translation initiation factor IF-3 [Paenibacillus macerans]|uniref:translation initiation factor IF-3 n=1 Tax=Paenibacillus macerans TaxID=44252 RepID=UPI003D318209